MHACVCAYVRLTFVFLSSAELAKSLGSNVLAVGKVDITSEVYTTLVIQKRYATYTTLLGRCPVSNRKDRGSLW